MSHEIFDRSRNGGVAAGNFNVPQWENCFLPTSSFSHLVRPVCKHLNLTSSFIEHRQYSLSFVHLYLHCVHYPLYTSSSFAFEPIFLILNNPYSSRRSKLHDLIPILRRPSTWLPTANLSTSSPSLMPALLMCPVVTSTSTCHLLQSHRTP